MRYPALNDLIKKADNKYSLVLATARRAREIIDGDEPLVKITIDNPVTIATNEISQNMIHCNYNKAKPERGQEIITEQFDVILPAMEEGKIIPVAKG